MSIMPPHRDDPMANCRLIASAILREVDGERPKSGTRTLALNSLFRLAADMGSHRYYGMRDESYGRLADILDECVGEASQLPKTEAWGRIEHALREIHHDEGTADDLRMVRTVAEAMRRRLEHQ